MNDYPLLHSFDCGIVDTLVMVASRFAALSKKVLEEKNEKVMALGFSLLFSSISFSHSQLAVDAHKLIDCL